MSGYLLIQKICGLVGTSLKSISSHIHPKCIFIFPFFSLPSFSTLHLLSPSQVDFIYRRYFYDGQLPAFTIEAQLEWLEQDLIQANAHRGISVSCFFLLFYFIIFLFFYFIILLFYYFIILLFYYFVL